MRFLAHRGLWLTPEEKNTRHALQRAFKAGLGVETDVRDLDGELVVSHDMPRRGALSLASVLSDYVDIGSPGTLAFNIKSDGLTLSLKSLLDYYRITDYFCFDMSVPDMLPYLHASMPVAARLSEYEEEGPLSRQSDVLWWDAFSERIPSTEKVTEWLGRGQRVCLVSPELHDRQPEMFWSFLAAMPASVRDNSNLMICTDWPQRVEEALS